MLLSEAPPGAEQVALALRAVARAFPELRAAVEPLPGLLHLVTPDGRTAVTLDPARFVPFPQEATRLLDATPARSAWWTELRGGPGPQHEAVLSEFVNRLAELLSAQVVTL
ncbi:hypothetical protein SAMN05444157_0977 [Frankineae bacterium MT45]|nr:hypothetical protein SAMN05444157_0977 [Frankineae bacterium MT45]